MLGFAQIISVPRTGWRFARVCVGIPASGTCSRSSFGKGRVIYYQVGRGRLYSGGSEFSLVMYWGGGEIKIPWGRVGSYISSGIWEGQTCSNGFCFH